MLGNSAVINSAIASPTSGMLSPASNRARPRPLLASMPSRRFCADFLPIRSSSSSWSNFSRYKSVTDFTRPDFTSCAVSDSPNPSMSIRPRVANDSTRLRIAAGQSLAFVQNTFPFRRSVGEPHPGHFVGNL